MMAGLPCWIYAGFSAFGVVISGLLSEVGSPEGIIALALASAAILLCVFAGFRMRAGKGAFLGIAVLVLMVLSILISVLTGQIGLGLILNVVVLIVLAQGLRGSWALRAGHFPDEDFEVFE